MPQASHHWVSMLLDRYRAVLDGPDNDESIQSVLVESFNSLRLADALLDKIVVQHSDISLPIQLSIIGPTQAGKSTFVNLLLDASPAGVSALAGYTVHAQGFAAGCSSDSLDAIQPIMNPFLRVSQATLVAAELQTYSLDTVQPGPGAIVPMGVVWDSPDFDSIAASGYHDAVLKCIAAADALVLMLSKDKYGDMSVWQMLSLLRELGRPLLVCINKLDPADEPTVRDAFTQRYQSSFDCKPPPLLVLPFIRATQNPQETQKSSQIQLPAEQLKALATTIHSALANIDKDKQQLACNQFIASQRNTWLTPVRDELDALTRWQYLVAEALDEAEELYVNAYLNDPHKYNTFNRALAELLSLLEIPGLAAGLARTRQLVTWPARKLLGLGRQVIHQESEQTIDQESEVLNRALDRALTRLQGELIEQQQESPQQRHWWLAMNEAFRNKRITLRADYQRSSETMQAEFEPRIQAAAQRLHSQLQSRPALLNSLRAARVTGDAAGVVLAVKSGGLAPADLIIAPAMLSVTTLLTESALGRYMDSIKRELRQEQRQLVRDQLLHGVLGKQLESLVQSLDGGALLTAGIDASVLNALQSHENSPS
ncbi:MAG: GTPase [Granulosicoccus sp.]